MPYGEETFLGLAMSASTDILDSVVGRMLRGLGRGKARELVTDVLEELRNDLEVQTTEPVDANDQ